MGKGKNPSHRVEQKARKAALKSYIEDTGNIEILKTVDLDSPALHDYLAGAANHHPSAQNLGDFLTLAFNTLGPNSPALEGIRHLRALEKMAKKAKTAGHRERRALVASLGLRNNPFSILDMISDRSLIPGIKLIWRERTTSDVKPRSVLSDTNCRPGQGDFVADAAAGFYIVPPSESVIFASEAQNGIITVELVVMRGVAYGAAQSENIYAWASEVVHTACSERRNVRPNHPGQMVQLGWNAGPRHARVWGLAVSYTSPTKREPDVMIKHDQDAISLLTLCWSLAKATLPSNVILPIETALAESGMPRIATRNIPEGTGYCLQLDGRIFSFPTFERAPPEGYMTQDYVAWVHKDACFAQYGLSWCVGRTIDGKNSRAREDSAAEDSSLWPKLGGGNFVDLTLRVVVQQAAGTLMAFQPEYPHGTTRLCGAHNNMVTITFSSRIAEAFEKAQQGNCVEPGAGAGEGNVD